MSKRIPDLSKAEWAVMQVVWNLKRAVARDIYEDLKTRHRWALTTVRTMLQRLVEKGYLSQHKIGAVYVYTPSIPRCQAVRRTLRDVVDRVLEGSLTPLVAYLLEEEEISGDDLKRLEDALQRKGRSDQK